MKVIIDGVPYIPAPAVMTYQNIPLLHRIFAAGRRRLKMPLREVAKITGMSVNTVHYAECHDNMTLLTAVKLCQAYGIDLNEVAKSVLAHAEEE